MTHLALAVTKNATQGELAMRCNPTSSGCLDGERKVGEHSLRGKPKSLRHQPRAPAYADGDASASGCR